MQSNYTLKQAVITALAMLTIGAQNSAFALGLGNIDVQSHLGQPLRASIQVQGANALKNAACFRVMNDSSAENQLSKAQFKLSKSVDDVAILTVTTSQIIQEPIVHLSVMAECDVNMRRDYVLLLDPQLTAEVKNAVDEALGEGNEANLNINNLTESPTALVETTTQQTIAAPVSSKVAATKKQKSVKKVDENIVLTTGYSIEKPADSTTQTADLTQKNLPKTSTARLSISAGESANVDLNSTSLRLDRQLRFTPETAPQVLAADIEVQDEVTVMSHRLMHLEKQINTLVLANQKLKAENQANSQQLAQSHSSRHSFDWLGYLLGGGLLASSYNIADKWRRRRQSQQLENTDLTWLTKHNSSNNHFEANEDLFAAESDADSRQQLNGDAEKSAGHVAESETKSALGTHPLDTHFFVEELDSEHNILDHADVFLSHGRTSLAIQLLQNYLLDYPKKSVTIWLFLLDLLAKENMQAVYEQTALECKEHFNIRVAAFTNDQASPKQCLEDFPRLNSGLQDVWGTPAALVYLDDLIYNSRLETRVGFEKSVLEELLLLKNIADEASTSSSASASVIQLDEKKLAIKELKEAQHASKKAEKLEKMHAINMSETLKKQALAKAEDKAEDEEATFEFSLIEHN